MSAATASFDDGWVWPYWLDRQLEPSSPAHVPGDIAIQANVTARNWTIVGNLDSPLSALVDPRGLVTPSPDGWSLDWWVGADDRWHLPSREVAVRQQLVEDMPLVETAMRVPGGDAVQRVFTVRHGGDELVVIDVENRSPAPFALALSVRPMGPSGWADVSRVALREGTVLTVDGRVALLLPRPPARMASSTLAGGDVAAVVLAGDAGVASEGNTCRAGRATAALVWPVAHRTSFRVAIPLRAMAVRRRGWRRVTGLALPTSLPTSAQVANGWRIQGDRGMRVEVPDPRLRSAVAANRRFLLLVHDDAGVTAPETSLLVDALHRYGYADESAMRLRSLLAVAPPDSSLLEAVAEHWQLYGDSALVADLAPAVAAGAEQLERKRDRQGDDARGLRAAATLLRAAGEERAALLAERAAGNQGLDVDRPLRVEIGADIDSAVPAVVAEQGRAELAIANRRALDRLAWLLDAATSTWTWPGAIHSRLPGGSAGDGHDRSAVGAFLLFVRDLLIRETPDGGLAVCSLVPNSWLGQGIEVHDAPTAAGRLSFAVRWHGDRPALLWELAPSADHLAVPITAPGLDPSWSSTALAGEALLEPVVPATPVTLGRPGSR